MTTRKTVKTDAQQAKHQAYARETFQTAQTLAHTAYWSWFNAMHKDGFKRDDTMETKRLDAFKRAVKDSQAALDAAQWAADVVAFGITEKIHRIRRNWDTGELECNCAAFTYAAVRMHDKPSCKHVQEAEQSASEKAWRESAACVLARKGTWTI